MIIPSLVLVYNEDASLVLVYNEDATAWRLQRLSTKSISDCNFHQPLITPIVYGAAEQIFFRAVYNHLSYRILMGVIYALPESWTIPLNTNCMIAILPYLVILGPAGAFGSIFKFV